MSRIRSLHVAEGMVTQELFAVLSVLLLLLTWELLAVLPVLLLLTWKLLAVLPILLLLTWELLAPQSHSYPSPSGKQGDSRALECRS